MDSFQAILVQTEWDELSHAYGAASDAPVQLEALLGEDAGARSAAVAYLDAAILHQGSVYSSTAPVARAVAAMLGEARTLESVKDVFPWDPDRRSLRAALLNWLGLVGEACRFEVEVKSPAVLACRAVVPELFGAVAPFLGDTDKEIRDQALKAAVHLIGHPDLARERAEELERLQTAVSGSADHWQRAAAAIVLGRMGLRPEELLVDTHPGVRACAAMAPACAGDPVATEEILTALQNPYEADRWFGKHLPGQEGRFRFDLVRAAIERADDFETLLPAALAVVPVASAWTVDGDWGLLLVAAFPTPYREGMRLTDAQHAYLSALVAHDEIWHPTFANPFSRCREAGFDYDRAHFRTAIER